MMENSEYSEKASVRNLVRRFENQSDSPPRTNLFKFKSKSSTSIVRQRPPLLSFTDEIPITQNILASNSPTTVTFKERRALFERPGGAEFPLRRTVSTNLECLKLQEINEISNKTNEIVFKIKKSQKVSSNVYISYLNEIVELLIQVGEIDTFGNVSIQQEKLATLQALQKCYFQLKDKIQALLDDGSNEIEELELLQIKDLIKKWEQITEKKPSHTYRPRDRPPPPPTTPKPVHFINDVHYEEHPIVAFEPPKVHLKELKPIKVEYTSAESKEDDPNYEAPKVKELMNVFQSYNVEERRSSSKESSPSPSSQSSNDQPPVSPYKYVSYNEFKINQSAKDDIGPKPQPALRVSSYVGLLNSFSPKIEDDEKPPAYEEAIQSSKIDEHLQFRIQEIQDDIEAAHEKIRNEILTSNARTPSITQEHEEKNDDQMSTEKKEETISIIITNADEQQDENALNDEIETDDEGSENLIVPNELILSYQKALENDFISTNSENETPNYESVQEEGRVEQIPNETNVENKIKEEDFFSLDSMEAENKIKEEEFFSLDPNALETRSKIRDANSIIAPHEKNELKSIKNEREPEDLITPDYLSDREEEEEPQKTPDIEQEEVRKFKYSFDIETCNAKSDIPIMEPRDAKIESYELLQAERAFYFSEETADKSVETGQLEVHVPISYLLVVDDELREDFLEDSTWTAKEPEERNSWNQSTINLPQEEELATNEVSETKNTMTIELPDSKTQDRDPRVRDTSNSDESYNQSVEENNLFGFEKEDELVCIKNEILHVEEVQKNNTTENEDKDQFLTKLRDPKTETSKLIEAERTDTNEWHRNSTPAYVLSKDLEEEDNFEAGKNEEVEIRENALIPDEGAIYTNEETNENKVETKINGKKNKELIPQEDIQKSTDDNSETEELRNSQNENQVETEIKERENNEETELIPEEVETRTHTTINATSTRKGVSDSIIASYDQLLEENGLNQSENFDVNETVVRRVVTGRVYTEKQKSVETLTDEQNRPNNPILDQYPSLYNNMNVTNSIITAYDQLLEDNNLKSIKNQESINEHTMVKKKESATNEIFSVNEPENIGNNKLTEGKILDNSNLDEYYNLQLTNSMIEPHDQLLAENILISVNEDKTNLSDESICIKSEILNVDETQKKHNKESENEDEVITKLRDPIIESYELILAERANAGEWRRIEVHAPISSKAHQREDNFEINKNNEEEEKESGRISDKVKVDADDEINENNMNENEGEETESRSDIEEIKNPQNVSGVETRKYTTVTVVTSRKGVSDSIIASYDQLLQDNGLNPSENSNANETVVRKVVTEGIVTGNQESLETVTDEQNDAIGLSRPVLDEYPSLYNNLHITNSIIMAYDQLLEENNFKSIKNQSLNEDTTVRNEVFTTNEVPSIKETENIVNDESLGSKILDLEEYKNPMIVIHDQVLEESKSINIKNENNLTVTSDRPTYIKTKTVNVDETQKKDNKENENEEEFITKLRDPKIESCELILAERANAGAWRINEVLVPISSKDQQKEDNFEINKNNEDKEKENIRIPGKFEVDADDVVNENNMENERQRTQSIIQNSAVGNSDIEEIKNPKNVSEVEIRNHATVTAVSTRKGVSDSIIASYDQLLQDNDLNPLENLNVDETVVRKVVTEDHESVETLPEYPTLYNSLNVTNSIIAAYDQLLEENNLKSIRCDEPIKPSLNKETTVKYEKKDEDLKPDEADPLKKEEEIEDNISGSIEKTTDEKEDSKGILKNKSQNSPAEVKDVKENVDQRVKDEDGLLQEFTIKVEKKESEPTSTEIVGVPQKNKRGVTDSIIASYDLLLEENGLNQGKSEDKVVIENIEKETVVMRKHQRNAELIGNESFDTLNSKQDEYPSLYPSVSITNSIIAAYDQLLEENYLKSIKNEGDLEESSMQTRDFGEGTTQKLLNVEALAEGEEGGDTRSKTSEEKPLLK